MKKSLTTVAVCVAAALTIVMQAIEAWRLLGYHLTFRYGWRVYIEGFAQNALWIVLAVAAILSVFGVWKKGTAVMVSVISGVYIVSCVPLLLMTVEILCKAVMSEVIWAYADNLCKMLAAAITAGVCLVMSIRRLRGQSVPTAAIAFSAVLLFIPVAMLIVRACGYSFATIPFKVVLFSVWQLVQYAAKVCVVYTQLRSHKPAACELGSL